MTSTRTHTCVFFEDGWTELLCTCGERALILDDEPDSGIVVAVYQEPSAVTRLPDAACQVLAASA